MFDNIGSYVKITNNLMTIILKFVFGLLTMFLLNKRFGRLDSWFDY